MQITNDKSAEKYRERRNDSDDDDEEEDVKPIVKTERLSPCEQQHANISDENSIRVLSGLHLTFNLEAGSLLPLAIKLVMSIETEFTQTPRQRRLMNNAIIIIAEAV